MAKEVDVVIVGAGVAGMSAAIYLKRANIDFVLLNKGPVGGKLNIINKIENYPGVPNTTGFDLNMSFMSQLKSLDIKSIDAEVKKIEKKLEFCRVFTQNEEFLCKYLIIATGVENKKLMIENEEKFIGKGISHCASCDGFFTHGKEVVVYANSDRGYIEALYLVDLVSKLYLVHDENFENNDHYQTLINSKNVTLLPSHTISKYIGEEKLEAVELKNLKSGEIIKIETNFCFPFTKEAPLDYVFSDLNLEKDKNFIKVNENLETSCENVYAIGDVVAKNLRQVVTACNDGAIAATAIIKKIKSKK